MVEQVLADYEKAYGLRSVSLRYFNAAGADPEGQLGERHDPETHLIPQVLQAASGRRPNIGVFGRDYDTPDATCVRDYIHIEDLCSAHWLALHSLMSGAGQPGLQLGQWARLLGTRGDRNCTAGHRLQYCRGQRSPPCRRPGTFGGRLKPDPRETWLATAIRGLGHHRGPYLGVGDSTDLMVSDFRFIYRGVALALLFFGLKKMTSLGILML